MDVDNKLQELESLLAQHNHFRDNCLNLIASENVPSPLVERMLSAELDRRYGYYLGIDVHDRWYLGNRYIAQIEELAQQLASELFHAEFVDLRPLSGNIAGIAATFGLARAGDTVLEVYNGHTYANKLATAPLKVDLKSIEIPWDGPTYSIDLDQTLALIEQHRPSVVNIGSGLFLFPSPVRKIKEAMRKHNPDSYLIYDAAHVLGLIAGGLFQDPLAEGADVVISSTHKTFAGPQGGLILTNDRAIAELMGEALSPLLIANHHLGRLPALAATFLEWLHCGPAHAAAIVANAKALGRALHERGVLLVGADRGFTETHTLLLVVDQFGESRPVADRLEACNIITGSSSAPAELGTHGLRIGSQELTRCGMVEEDAPEIADCLVDALHGRDLENVKTRATKLAQRFQRICFTLDSA
jgi:glycine hydroxymethyltransferase